jgi:DNA topoisomerase VI subunit B
MIPTDIDFGELKNAAQESADELQEFLASPEAAEESDKRRDLLQRLLDTYNGSIVVLDELVKKYSEPEDETSDPE